MKRLLFLAIFIAAAVDARVITEKDLFRFQWIADPQLSPDASQIAFVKVTVDEKKDRYDTSIWSVSAHGGTPRQMTTGTSDSAPRWSPDGKSLAFLRAVEKDGKPQPSQIFILPLDGGEPRAVTSLSRAIDSLSWSPSGRTIAFTARTKPEDLEEKKKTDEQHVSDVRVINQATYRFNGAGYTDVTRAGHIWSVDVPTSDETAKPKQLTSGEFSEGEPVWSPDGSRIYFTSNRVLEAYYERQDSNIYSIPASGGDMVKVADIDGSVGEPSPSPDGKWIAFRGTISNPVHSYEQPDLFVVSTTGGEARNLTASFDNDVLGGVGGDQAPPRANRGARAMWSRDSKTIYVTTAEQGKVNLKRVDVDTGAMTAWTGGKQDIETFIVRDGIAILLISTPRMIGDLFAVDDKGAITRLTNINEKLFSEITLTEPDEMLYKSFDGKTVEAWIQKPPDFDPTKKYPMILNIHGGPHAASGYTFDHEFQWMAAKGYVVLYPNPRGSTSYGEAFGNIIQYHYPGDDYKDLMAGVDALIAKGYIDTKKLGVTGGSGGGLLTNWVITQTDRFAAAVSQRDIADWSNFWYVADFTLFQPTWFRKAPWEDPEDYKARSPITYIERVKTPLMLIEGEADYRTPPMAGGEMMFRALKYRHIPTVMVRFPDESHELSRSGKPWHRIERLQYIVGWFDQWLMGQKNPAYERGLRAAK